MNPDQLSRLSHQELSDQLRNALAQNDAATAQDVFVQLETRFLKLFASAEGSGEFMESFLFLVGCSELRARHIADPLVRCVAHVEYLLELAGDRARSTTPEATLSHIVASRERGMDLINALSHAPEHGMSAGDLAFCLRITPQNLSPLIRSFHAHGIIDRCQHGKSAFLKLTPQGKALVLVNRQESNNLSAERDQYLNRDPFGALRKLVVEIRDSPYASKKSTLGVAHHALREWAKENPTDPKITEKSSEILSLLKESIGLPVQTS